MLITEERLNVNFTNYVKKLEKYGAYSKEMIDEIGESIKNGTFCGSEDGGGAYKGALVYVTLTKLCVLAYQINNDVYKSHPLLYVDQNSLMKVLLLQHISKIDIFKPQSEAWKVKKGWTYEFNNDLTTSLKCGERSLYICQKYGIKFTEEEYEAMKIIDREDEKNNIFISPLASLVKTVNKIVDLELYCDYKAENSKKNQIEQ